MKYLVLDIGGSAIKYSIMNEKAEFYEKGQVSTPLDSIDSFIDTIGKIFERYKDGIEGIALSMPGCIDSDRGYAHTGGFLLYNYDKDIVSLLGERCPVPITVENDGKCAALAEAWIGSLADCSDGIVVVLGSGVGGGIIKGKKLHKGRHFVAGEFSYIFTNNASNEGLYSQVWAGQAGSNGLLIPVSKVKQIPLEELDGHKVFKLANDGDEEVLRILDDYCYNIVVQLFNLQYIYDPEKIAIGGGISSQDILFKYIQSNIEKHAKILPYNMIIPEVVPCKFRNDSNMIGALHHYITKMK
jgi:predicted NBD/HSP70 family sugar kinase